MIFNHYIHLYFDFVIYDKHTCYKYVALHDYSTKIQIDYLKNIQTCVMTPQLLIVTQKKRLHNNVKGGKTSNGNTTIESCNF